MSSTIIDRRLNGRHKSLPNRERFIRRYKEQLKRAVADVANTGSIADVARDGSVRVPVKDTKEPQYTYGEGGDRDYVVPGNEDFVPGDRIPRPRGSDNESGAGDGEGEDNFTFVLSRDEFLSLYFDDLELPELLQKDLTQLQKTKPKRAGYTRDGVPSRLSVPQTMKAALARQIALAVQDDEELALIEEREKETDPVRIAELTTRIEEKVFMREHVPMLDDVDLRYRNQIQVPQPATNAVMFCLMDVSGSMDETRKDLAKRFFTLLYLFLHRKYEKVELVFVRHTTEADEVDEQEFFYGKKSGGTHVLSGLTLVDKIIDARYPVSAWNIYLAQASDGDALTNDAQACGELLSRSLFHKLRYMAYIEIGTPSSRFETPMLTNYRALAERNAAMGVKTVSQRSDIYPVFRSLFEKKA